MRVKDERSVKAKTDSNVLTIQTLVGFSRKVNTLAVENLERVPITRTSVPFKISIIMLKTWMNLQTPIESTMPQLTLEAMTEKKLWSMYVACDEKDTFSSDVALDDVTVFEAAELDAIALLAVSWNDDLDPDVSAQLVQESAQAHFSLGKDKGKGKGKAQGEGKGRYLVDRLICRWRTVDDD